MGVALLEMESDSPSKLPQSQQVGSHNGSSSRLGGQQWSAVEMETAYLANQLLDKWRQFLLNSIGPVVKYLLDQLTR
jgi:hypothetical protein